jgi:hypothetical protein
MSARVLETCRELEAVYTKKRIVRRVGYLQELLLGIARRIWLSTFREMSAPFFQDQVVRELPFPSRWK